jgi:hypothetical protein
MFLRQKRLAAWKKFFSYEHSPHLNILRDIKYIEGLNIAAEAVKVRIR